MQVVNKEERPILTDEDRKFFEKSAQVYISNKVPGDDYFGPKFKKILFDSLIRGIRKASP